MLEMMFGVQQGDSDTFLSTEQAETSVTSSRTWPRSCAMAEMQFFRHRARPEDTPWAAGAAGDREHAAQLVVGIAFTPFLPSESTLWGVGPDAAEGAVARDLATETPVTPGQQPPSLFEGVHSRRELYVVQRCQ